MRILGKLNEIKNASSLTVLEVENMVERLINCSYNFISVKRLIPLYTDRTNYILASLETTKS